MTATRLLCCCCFFKVYVGVSLNQEMGKVELGPDPQNSRSCVIGTWTDHNHFWFLLYFTFTRFRLIEFTSSTKTRHLLNV